MNDQLLQRSGEVALKGLTHVESMLDGAELDETLSKKAQVGMTLLRGHASLRSTRAREASVLVSAAKHCGAKGEALNPVFEMLTGRAPLLEKPTDTTAVATAAA